MMNRRQLLGAALGYTSLPLLASTAQGGSWRILFGFGSGGPTTEFAKAFLPLFGREAGIDFGKDLVYLPGSSGIKALEQVAYSSNEGGTLLMSPAYCVTLLPRMLWLTGNVPPPEPRAITQIAEYSFCFCVNASKVPSSVNDLRSFIAWTKEHPEHASYGHPGGSTSAGFLGACLQEELGFALRSQSYVSIPTLVNEVVDGALTAAFSVTGAFAKPIQEGSVRALFVTSRKRWPSLPQVPTLMETTGKNLWAGDNFGLFAPPGIRPDMVAQLEGALARTLADKGLQQALIQRHMQAPVLSSNDYQSVLDEDRRKWVSLIDAHPRAIAY